jgi:hypothetical protein
MSQDARLSLVSQTQSGGSLSRWYFASVLREGNERLSCVMWACHAREVTVCQIPTLRRRFVECVGFVPQLGLPIYHRGHLAYLGVEALTSPPPGGAGAGTRPGAENFFLFCHLAISLYFSAVLFLFCGFQCSSSLLLFFM